MSVTPTFSLPACPLCSTRGSLVQPVWMVAHNTSAREGRLCYMWSGCQHAAEVRSSRPCTTAEEYTQTEADWRARLPRLLAQKTERWTSEQRAEFARVIEDRPVFFMEPTQPALATNNEKGENENEHETW